MSVEILRLQSISRFVFFVFSFLFVCVAIIIPLEGLSLRAISLIISSVLKTFIEMLCAKSHCMHVLNTCYFFFSILETFYVNL